MKKTIQRIVQFLFLGLFIFLLIRGKVQMWMGIFLLSLVLSLFFSRFYCGWICPINTFLKPITFLKKKFHVGSIKTPSFFKNGGAEDPAIDCLPGTHGLHPTLRQTSCLCYQHS
nr:4Fe-4S binding protein [uncultured Sphaerochaeta sp.]